MTEKQRLMHALFGHAEREHRNIKFFRGMSNDVTVEGLCREAANGIEEILTGLVSPVTNLDAGTREEREVSELVAAL
jgi:hypothetical protein